jgi:starch-binding outer membrane protein, SusD/RagB family
MKKQKMKKQYISWSVFTMIASLFFFSSCKDMLDADIKDAVPEDKNFQNASDSRSMVLGINALHKTLLADQYVLLGELRGDLLDATNNADEYLRQISRHDVDVTKANPYIKPENFYKLILSCNDAFQNMRKMYRSGKLNSANFSSDSSEVMAFRCWTYYLLAVHFGNIPYITQPIESVEALKKSNFPSISLEAVIDSLLPIMQHMSKKSYAESAPPWPLIDNTYYLGKTFVHRTMFLGDLLLWHGDYEEAAKQYKEIMSSFSSKADDECFTRYKCNTSYWTFTTSDAWPNMFKAKTTSKAYLKEWLWICYNKIDYGETNSLVDYFSSSNGRYLLRPTQLSMDNWSNEVLQNGSQGDKRGENAAWKMENGKPVVKKYLNYVTGPFNKDADMYIYRAGTLALRYAEAVNCAKNYKLALAILGPQNISSYPVYPGQENGVYDFSYQTITNGKIFSATIGPRGRAYLPAPVLPDLSMTGKTLQDTLNAVEDIIVKEYALEAAYEGERWMDILRVALRREKQASGTGINFLASLVSKKFEASDPALASQVKTRLEKKENWFLPFIRK